MPSFLTTMYAFALSNLPVLAQFAVLLGAIGLFFGWLAGRFAGTKAANVFSIIAAGTIDVLKIVDEFIAFCGGQPPLMGRKRTTRGPFDNSATVPTVTLKAPDSGKLPGMKRLSIFAFVGCLTLAPFVIVNCALVVPTANEIACLSGQLASNPNSTPAQYMQQCGITTLALLEQALSILANSFAASPTSDAGVAGVLPDVSPRISPDVRAIMLDRITTLQNRLSVIDAGSK
jgi:hypothetical protein